MSPSVLRFCPLVSGAAPCQNKLHMRNTFSVSVIALVLSGCAAKEGPTPIQSPRGEHPGFAEEYPNLLQAALDDYAKDIARAEAIATGFSEYPSAFKEPNWPLLRQVYDAAEEDGKSGYYGDVLQEQEGASRYFEEAKPELVKRAGGAVEYETKKNKCEGEGEYYGAVSRGLDKGLEADSDEQLEAASRAQRLITQKGSELSKADQATLKKQASQIALAVYLVKVSLPKRHARLAELEAERGKVESTLKKRKKELDEEPPADKASAEAKKSFSEEQKLVADSQANLEGPHTAAKQRLETSEKTVKDTQNRVDDALKKLKKAVKDKAALGDLD
jgi:hypothetical protein